MITNVMPYTDKTNLESITNPQLKINYSLNYLWWTIKLINKNLTHTVIFETVFLVKYYSRNELIWQDGFLFDFLQKKSTDLWLRKFVIYTGFIFSERLVFDSVTRIYLDNLIWPLHNNYYLENENVAETLTTLLYFYSSIFITIVFAINIM